MTTISRAMQRVADDAADMQRIAGDAHYRVFSQEVLDLAAFHEILELRASIADTLLSIGMPSDNLGLAHTQLQALNVVFRRVDHLNKATLHLEEFKPHCDYPLFRPQFDYILQALDTTRVLAMRLISDSSDAAVEIDVAMEGWERRQDPPNRVANFITRCASRILPAAHRTRYSDELRSELHDLTSSGASRWQQVLYAMRVFDRAWILRAELKSPAAANAGT